MSTLYDQIFLRFDFQPNKEQAVTFTKPLDIITTWKLEHVLDCFHKAELALQAGYYIAGYVSYEAAYGIHDACKIDHISPSMPLLWFGVFHESASHFDRETTNYTVQQWKLAETKENYSVTFTNIIEKMRKNDVEQINYTVPFYTQFSGDSYAYYKDLTRNQQGSYSAYLHIGNEQILSISPELFFHLNDHTITVKPMKGTIHRGKTYEEDVQLKHWLATSQKNKLENEMITNLMKEELSSIVESASIRIIDPFKIEQYPTVYQMTTTIEGTLKHELSITDIFKALFPPSSICGVPKRKAIELIQQFESYPRDVYCGAIGYMTPNRKALFNVPIRTVTIDRTKNIAKFGAGGAITLYSDASEEYAEILTKAKFLQIPESFQLLETFGLVDGEYIAFHEHIKRLKNSATYFNFQIDLPAIRKQLLYIKQNYQKGDWRIRLVVDKTGKFSVEINELKETKNCVVQLAKRPIDKNNIFHYHKTTNRTIYEEHLKEADKVFDVLLWNDQNEITEFTIGNAVVELEGKLYTPPVHCGLLAGTFREKLLKEGVVEERIIYVDELKACSNIYLINSVRQWIPVKLQNKKGTLIK